MAKKQVTQKALNEPLRLFGDVYQLGDILNLANAMPLKELAKLAYLLDLLARTNHKKGLKSLINLHKNEQVRLYEIEHAKNQELEKKIKG